MQGWQEEAGRALNAECVSRHLHTQILIEETQLYKKVDMLRQEKKKLQEDWVLLKHHLEDLILICKNQVEESSDLKIQQQVGALDCLSAHPPICALTHHVTHSRSYPATFS